MWADAQRDGRPGEYSWRPLRKFSNSIPCTTPQSLPESKKIFRKWFSGLTSHQACVQIS